MHNTGAPVSEIINAVPAALSEGPTATLQLRGKGRKEPRVAQTATGGA